MDELSTISCSCSSCSCGRAPQVKLLLGFHVPRGLSCMQTARYLVTHIRETIPAELALGALWLAILLTMKHFGKSRRALSRLWAVQRMSVVWPGRTHILQGYCSDV